MRMLNKTEQIASLQGKNRFERQNAIQDMLIAYRSTPHPATGITPYEAMRGATVRIKLDYLNPEMQKSERDDIINQRDAEYKQRMKQQREGRHPLRKKQHKETASLDDTETLSKEQEPPQQETGKDLQTATSEAQTIDQPLNTRPRRERRKPTYLQDFELT